MSVAACASRADSNRSSVSTPETSPGGNIISYDDNHTANSNSNGGTIAKQFSTSADLHCAVTELDEKVQQQEQVAATTKKRSQSDAKLMAGAAVAIDEQNKRIVSDGKRIRGLENDKRDLRTKLAATLSNLANTQRMYTQAKNNVQELKAGLAAETGEKAIAQRDAQALRTQLDAAQKSLVVLQTELTQREEDVQQLTTQLNDRDVTIVALTEKNINTEQLLADAQHDISVKAAELGRSDRALLNLGQDLEDLFCRIQLLAPRLDEARRRVEKAEHSREEPRQLLREAVKNGKLLTVEKRRRAEELAAGTTTEEEDYSSSFDLNDHSARCTTASRGVSPDPHEPARIPTSSNNSDDDDSHPGAAYRVIPPPQERVAITAAAPAPAPASAASAAAVASSSSSEITTPPALTAAQCEEVAAADRSVALKQQELSSLEAQRAQNTQELKSCEKQMKRLLKDLLPLYCGRPRCQQQLRLTPKEENLLLEASPTYRKLKAQQTRLEKDNNGLTRRIAATNTEFQCLCHGRDDLVSKAQRTLSELWRHRLQACDIAAEEACYHIECEWRGGLRLMQREYYVLCIGDLASSVRVFKQQQQQQPIPAGDVAPPAASRRVDSEGCGCVIC